MSARKRLLDFAYGLAYYFVRVVFAAAMLGSMLALLAVLGRFVDTAWSAKTCGGAAACHVFVRYGAVSAAGLCAALVLVAGVLVAERGRSVRRGD